MTKTEIQVMVGEITALFMSNPEPGTKQEMPVEEIIEIVDRHWENSIKWEGSVVPLQVAAAVTELIEKETI